MNYEKKVSIHQKATLGNRWVWNAFNRDFIHNPAHDWAKEKLNTPLCRIDSKEVSARLKNSWIKQGLIEDKRQEFKGWHKFTISESVWINIMSRLRRFNLSLAQIKKVRECLMFCADECSLSDMPYLDFFIVQAMLGTVVQLAVTHTGEAFFITTFQVAELKQKGEFYDYISIDLNSIVNIFFDKLDTNYQKVVELSELEEKAIDSVRYSVGVKSLNIQVKANQIFELEREVVEYSNSRMIDVANSINYGKVETKVHNNQVVEIIKREKFKPQRKVKKTA